MTYIGEIITLMDTWAMLQIFFQFLLTYTLEWRHDVLPLGMEVLDDLQGNLLTTHATHNTSYIFIRELGIKGTPSMTKPICVSSVQVIYPGS